MINFCVTSVTNHHICLPELVTLAIDGCFIKTSKSQARAVVLVDSKCVQQHSAQTPVFAASRCFATPTSHLSWLCDCKRRTYAINFALGVFQTYSTDQGVQSRCT